MTMHMFPNVRRDNIDAFENDLTEALDTLPMKEFTMGTQRALRYIEKEAERVRLNMNYINNATSTAMRAVAVLADRLLRAQAELAALKKTAETQEETGDGGA